MMPVEDMPLPPPPEGRSSLFQALFEFPVSACELRGIGSPQSLLPAERDSIAGAVPARIAEFAAGRHCAHQALQAFGVAADVPLLRGPRREPLWPAGLVGSITHTAGYCAAVVAPASACAGLGIDAEHCGQVGTELWPLLFDASELALLRAQDPLNNGHLGPARQLALRLARAPGPGQRHAASRQALSPCGPVGPAGPGALRRVPAGV